MTFPFVEEFSLADTPIEEVLNNVNPDWKDQPLYRWQWDKFDRKDQNPRDIYDLAEFSESEPKILLNCTVYQKDQRFVVERCRGSNYDVLSNMKPGEDLIHSSFERNQGISLLNLFGTTE